jgi:hypothetical protein
MQKMTDRNFGQAYLENYIINHFEILYACLLYLFVSITFLKKYMYVFCLLIASWSWSTSCVGHLSFMASMVVEVWSFLAVVAEK